MSVDLSKLTTETLETIAPTAIGVRKLNLSDENKEKEMVSQIMKEAEWVGVKELAFMMNKLELRDICDNYLKVEYKEGANKNNKMMLTKRIMESFEDIGVDKWVKQCKDKKVLTTLSTAMGIEADPKLSFNDLKEKVIDQIYLFGETVVFHRLSVEQLRMVCEDMEIDGAENTQSKRILVDAIINRTAIPARAPTKKATVTKKVAIGKAGAYLELYQHYKLAELENWCRENGLKTSGTKKVLIERILAYNGGDTENTMATEPNTPKKQTKKPKKATVPKRKTKKEEKASEPEPEEEDEEMEVAPEPVKPTKSKAKKPAAKKKPAKAKEPEPEPEPEEDDDEEMEAAPEPVKPTKSKAKKPAAKKKPVKAKEPEPEPEPEEEVDAEEAEAEPQADAESEHEESVEEAKEYDEEAEKAAIDAERELRTNEEEHSSEVEVEVSQSASAEKEFPTDLSGQTVCLYGKFKNHSSKEIRAAIEKANATYSKNLTKKVTVLICNSENKDPSSAKVLKAAAKFGIAVESDEYLTNFY